MKEIRVNATYGTTQRRMVRVKKIDTWYNPIMEEHRVRVHYEDLDGTNQSWMEPVDFDNVFRRT